jgi:hypothetical protein
MPLRASVAKKVIAKYSKKIALAKKSASAIESGLSVRRFEKRVARTAIKAAKRTPSSSQKKVARSAKAQA